MNWMSSTALAEQRQADLRKDAARQRLSRTFRANRRSNKPGEQR